MCPLRLAQDPKQIHSIPLNAMRTGLQNWLFLNLNPFFLVETALDKSGTIQKMYPILGKEPMKNHTQKITLILTLAVILLSACNATPQVTEQIPTATTESLVAETEAPTAHPTQPPLPHPPMNGRNPI